ncbi:GH25 family lysozyme [Paenimyroides aestuarii]|uniref:Glycoside hydrolase family 25 protein n=1 Tax=Paenimyroides aestuarii TaxID=2968490 RepID=A0ABY5NPI3_9FLAO|nr:GH25 family lysozyme [Paenimyroides aestuarii]UUV20433.1 glycoside hydrolase family 25 protein [Paenimyroides aestuarii]
MTAAKPKKYVRKKTTRKRKKTPRWKWHVLAYALLMLLFLVFHYRDGIGYFVTDLYERIFKKEDSKEVTVHDIRAIEILDKHSECLFGFDVSHYQYEIDWKEIDSLYGKFAVDYVFLRSTMGIDGVDTKFDYNWKKAKSRLLVRGAYHYYRPDENSTQQAQNFIKNTKLEPGDFFPVLDIEELPKEQSKEKMREGLKNWLLIVEKHYGVKPIIYSGANFYEHHLKDHFPEHKIWIAKYSLFSEKMNDDWHFWQFTDKGTVNGIQTKVDLNIFKGDRHDLKQFVIQ